MPGLAVRSSARPALDPHWETETGGHIISLRWSPGGTALAAATADGPILILDEDSGRPRVTVPGHHGGTVQVDWRPGPESQGGVLASAGCDGRVRLWHPHLGAEMMTLDAGAEWVERLAWSPTGEFLATAAGRKLRLWDFRDPAAPGKLLHTYPDQQSTIADIAWKPGSSNVLASCGYNGLAFWSPSKPDATRKFDWKGSTLTLTWSPDAKYIATGNQDSTIQFWYVDSGKELQMWGYRTKIRELAWDGRSRFLASGGSATGVVWDCSGKGPAGTKPHLLEYHSALLSQLTYQSEGAILASGCQEGLVAMWRPGKEKQPLATAHLGSAITQLAWTPSNKRLAAGTAAGLVAVFRTPKP
ncbi:MAG: WD40 repeat domain-containing protein [Bryobacteraceae bacterium]|nr:WD40 repeat domain-containing protein [Bryobacteraceae bacterium]